MRKKVRFKLVISILMMSILICNLIILAVCNKDSIVKKYYDDATSVLGYYGAEIKVGEIPTTITKDWTQEQRDCVLGLTYAEALIYEDDIYYIYNTYGGLEILYDPIMIEHCTIYIVVPEAEVVFHEMVHVWDYYHYGITLRECEVSYLACIIMYEKGYANEAQEFYNESIERDDIYSFKNLTEYDMNSLEQLYELISGEEL